MGLKLRYNQMAKERIIRKNVRELLPVEIAGQLLTNVFDACGYEQNSVPLEALTSYSNYRKQRFMLQRIALLSVIVLFVLLPMLFISANIVITLTSDEDNPVYNVSISSGLLMNVPVDRIVAQIDGKNVPLYETSDNEYIIKPGRNGDLTVSVSLINQQTDSVSLAVDSVDKSAPYLVSSENRMEGIELKVDDADNLVNYDDITVTDSDENKIPFSVNRETDTIIIPYPDEIYYVRVPDTRDNVLTIRLKNDIDAALTESVQE